MKRKCKYKSVITRRILQSVEKIGVCVLIVSFFAPMMAMRGTNAGFLDEEKSERNSITAGTLDATAVQTYLGYTTGSEPMEPGDAITQRVNFKNDGSLTFQYKVEYFSADGGDLCNALLLTAKKDSTLAYDKLPLKDFDSGDIFPPAPPVTASTLILNPSESDDWEFILELPADLSQTLENETCDFNFKFTAWQPDFTDNSLGFWDEEMANPDTGGIEIETGEWEGSGDVVINEIMWMGNEGNDNDEWIELRNMTDKEVDISNWKIVHGGSGATGHIQIPNGYSIKANGYFLLTAKKWNETAIKLDSDLAKDEGYTHVAGGMSLLNGGEDLILQNKNEINIDTAWKYSAWPTGCDDKSGVCEGLYQSMERENIPGDGTQSSSWHTCVSGNCNDGTYWDTADGNNYGTPGAANLSPVVMNEFVANPLGDDSANKPDGEWIELFNISERKVDVSGWYFQNSQDEKITISEDNVKDTEIAGGERLVVYLEKDFLDNDKDTLSFYNGIGTPEDIYEYEKASEFPEGKSIARFPDGMGIWIDPEATPGEENKLGQKELDAFRVMTFDTCFDGKGKLEENSEKDICAPEFLKYLGMIKELDDDKINGDMELEVLYLKKDQEEKKLADLLKETEELNAVQDSISEEEKPVVASIEEDIPADIEPVDDATAVETVETEKEPVVLDSEIEKTEPVIEEKEEESENTEIPAIKEEENNNNSTGSNNEQQI